MILSIGNEICTYICRTRPSEHPRSVVNCDCDNKHMVMKVTSGPDAEGRWGEKEEKSRTTEERYTDADVNEPE